MNESTSILQLDTSGLQNGAILPIYVSSTTIPGQLVTVIDARGYLSSPQKILLTPVGTTADGFIQQRFGYLTIISQSSDEWRTVNCNSFPTSNPIFYRATDVPLLNTNTFNAYAFISTPSLITGGIDIRVSSENTGEMFVSSMNVNSYQAYISTSVTDPRLRIWGRTKVYGSTNTIGTVNLRGSVSTSGDVFTRGNISSKLGIIYVGGDVSVQGSIRAQRGIQMTVQALSSFGAASFNLPTTALSVSTAASLTTLRASTVQLSANFLGANSTIVVGSNRQAIQYRPGFLNFLTMPITTPSISSVSVTSSNALTTSNLAFQSFGPASTLQRFDMSGAQILNADGSLDISSVAGSYLTLAGVNANRAEILRQATATSLTMNDESYSGSTMIGPSLIPMYWSISSIGQNGKLNAPNRRIHANLLSTRNIVSDTLNTQAVTITEFNTSSMIVTNSIFFSSANTLSLKGVNLFNIGGSIRGDITDTASDILVSSIQTDYISSPNTITFYGNSTFSMSTASISSLTSQNIVTSSLTFANGALGNPVLYSTINPTAAWLQTSATPPFTTTSGLGTYFDRAIFSSARDQTAYYSLINPLLEPTFLPSPYVNTVAGRGSIGYSGDGGPASNASIGYIVGQPAIDIQSNVFFGANTAGWRLRKIDTANTITTVAGAPQFFYGDGQYPTAAALGPKLSVSVVSPGTLLVTDASNVRLRFVDAQPVIQTIAGTGQTGYSGDGPAFTATFLNPNMTATDSAGNIFVADTSNNMIRLITGFSTISRYAGSLVAGATGDGGAPLSASLAAPYGVVVDSANVLYITDTSNCVVRTVSGTIQRFAGNYIRGFSGDGGAATAAQLAYPKGIAADPARNIYVADTGNSRIRRIAQSSGIISTIAGNGAEGYSGDNGPACSASLSSPTGVATDLAGNIYIADTNNNCIRFVNVGNGYINTVAGRPPRGGYSGNNTFATSALLSTPTNVAYDTSSGFLYISDEGNRRIRLLNTPTGIIYDYVGNGSPYSLGDQIPASNAIFGSITGVVADLQDNVYVADGGANIIRKIDAVSGIITSAVGTGGGGFTGDGPALTASVSTPRTMVADASNNILFCDTDNHRIRKYFSTSRTVQTIAGTGVAGYAGDTDYASTAQLNFPKALALDMSGNIFVGDSSNYRIRRIDAATGIITTYAGTGVSGTIVAGGPATTTPISFITALTTDHTNTLYMTDYDTNGLWQISTGDATFQSLSAISTPSYLGDAGPLSNAKFNAPMGVITDVPGNFIIADSGNYRLRRSYIFGLPQTPTYLTLLYNFTNYYATTGTASISINGNTLATFTSSSVNSSFSLTDKNIFEYPLQGSNPVLGDQTPYIVVSEVAAGGYMKFAGSIFVTQVPGQQQQINVDPTAGLIMNAGTLRFPNSNTGITLDNQYNDISTRNLNYTGSLLNASDPALKEQIQPANLQICYENLDSIPLRTYSYSAAYQSTFHVRDKKRLGFLTSEVSSIFPHSITPIPFEHAWAPSTVNTLDLGQIKYSHIGTTQSLIHQISTMEAEVGELQNILRSLATQRNVIH
jgi:sugar lactone lactonase YvrE